MRKGNTKSEQQTNTKSEIKNENRRIGKGKWKIGERERERNLPSPGGCNLLPSSLPSTSALSSPNLLIPREEGGRDELKRKRSEGRCAVRADLVFFFLMRAP